MGRKSRNAKLDSSYGITFDFLTHNDRISGTFYEIFQEVFITMKRIAASLVLIMLLVFACAALAADTPAAPGVDFSKSEAVNFDFLKFAKERVLPDFHPTVKLENAEANYDEEPFQKGDVIRARVGIYYKGWIQQHSMVIDMDYRPEDNKIKVTLISDSNKMNLVGNRFFKDGEWVSLAAMGWK